MALRMIIGGPWILRLLLNNLGAGVDNRASCLLDILLRTWTLGIKSFSLHVHERRRSLKVTYWKRMILLKSHVHQICRSRSF